MGSWELLVRLKKKLAQDKKVAIKILLKPIRKAKRKNSRHNSKLRNNRFEQLSPPYYPFENYCISHIFTRYNNIAPHSSWGRGKCKTDWSDRARSQSHEYNHLIQVEGLVWWLGYGILKVAVSRAAIVLLSAGAHQCTVAARFLHPLLVQLMIMLNWRYAVPLLWQMLQWTLLCILLSLLLPSPFWAAI